MGSTSVSSPSDHRAGIDGGGLISYAADFLNQYLARWATSTSSSRERSLPICRGTANQIRTCHQPEDCKVLGLDIPPTLLARADEVIE
jgi:hypothetical protein